jgi:hypothetical protein
MTLFYGAEISAADCSRLERGSYRNGRRRHFIQPDLVLIVLHIERDLSRCYDRVGGIVRGRTRKELVFAVAVLRA